MKGAVGSVCADIGEEGLLGLGVAGNELVGLIEEDVRAKALGPDDLAVMKIASVEVGVVPHVGGLSHSPATMAIDFLEATVLRAIGVIVPHMPFSEHARFVPVVLEHLA